MSVFFKEIEKVYKNLRERRPDYNKGEYKWKLGVGLIQKIEHEFAFFRYVDCTGVKNTLFGMEIEIDYLDPFNIQIFEDITDKIAVVIDKSAERDEVIKMLTVLKKKSCTLRDDTVISDVKLDNFNFVINKTIKLLEAESEV